MEEKNGGEAKQTHQEKIITAQDRIQAAVNGIISDLGDEHCPPVLVRLAGTFAAALQEWPTISPHLFDEETGRPLTSRNMIRAHLIRVMAATNDPELRARNALSKEMAERVIALVDSGQQNLAYLRGKPQHELTETERTTANAFTVTEAARKSAATQILTGRTPTDEETEWAVKVVTEYVPNILGGLKLSRHLQDYTLPL